MGKTLITIALFIGFGFTLPTIADATVKEAGEAAKLATAAGTVVEKKVDKRVVALNQYLISINSPLAVNAKTFVELADEYELDWRLVPAIAGLESSFGKRIPRGSHNPFGWGVYTGRTSGVVFASWEEAITIVSKSLKEKYVDDGLVTVEQIGKRYAASTTWAPRIRYIMEQFEIASTTPSPSEMYMTL